MDIAELQRAQRACRRCVDAGLLPSARPVFSGRRGQRILLVGQAPGPAEREEDRPFAGRAGRQLVRWMVRAGFAGEDDLRRRVYLTSMTTCFPGRRPGGSGDRRPSAREVALCAPWLEELLHLLSPRLLLPVGSLALERFLPGNRLDAVVGEAFDLEGRRLDAPAQPGRGPASGLPPQSDAPILVPLPHPSGQSRWLNEPGRARRLEAALGRIRGLVAWAEAPSEAVLSSGDAQRPPGP